MEALGCFETSLRITSQHCRQLLSMERPLKREALQAVASLAGGQQSKTVSLFVASSGYVKQVC
jgi:hypothetical protein